jgi:hypothetical protein
MTPGRIVDLLDVASSKRHRAAANKFTPFSGWSLHDAEALWLIITYWCRAAGYYLHPQRK